MCDGVCVCVTVCVCVRLGVHHHDDASGGPGDPEITPLTNTGECMGNITSPSITKPMAICRDNYGYGTYCYYQI